jgi:hypothetical protein
MTTTWLSQRSFDILSPIDADSFIQISDDKNEIRQQKYGRPPLRCGDNHVRQSSVLNCPGYERRNMSMGKCCEALNMFERIFIVWLRHAHTGSVFRHPHYPAYMPEPSGFRLRSTT